MSEQCTSISEFLSFDGEEVRCSLPRGHADDHEGPAGRGNLKQVWDTSRIRAVDDSDDVWGDDSDWSDA